MPRLRFFLLGALPLLALATGGAHAGTAEDAARDFLQQAASASGANASVTVQPPAAVLPACADPRPFLPGSGQRLVGRVTVGVRCADGQARYLQARIVVNGRYWVAAQDIPPNSVVTAAMLAPRDGDLSQLPRAAIRDPAAANGRVTTSAIGRGAVVQQTELRTAPLVHRSRQVSIEAVGPGFRIIRAGEALQDGGIGDTVRVRLANRSVVTGVVEDTGNVKVNY